MSRMRNHNQTASVQIQEVSDCLKTGSAKLRRNRTLACGVILALTGILATWSANPDANLKPASLRIGFNKTLFLNVNRNDAEAAFKALADVLGRNQGYLVTPHTQVFEDAAGFEAAIKDSSVILVVFDSWQFLSMDIHKFVKPYFVTSEQGKVGKKYVLLTRRGSGLGTLEDLRGKDIVELDVSGANLGRPWLETLLLANRLGTHTSFFGRAENAGKPSTAVLSVFFGKKHACVVDESGYEIMKELNPQVGNQLQVIATSEPYANNVICLTHSGWASEDYKRAVIESLAVVHTEPAGQQILTLFKIGQLVPFEEKQLETVKKLRATYDRLLGQSR